MERKFFRESIKNKFVTVGLTAAAILLVMADSVGEMLSAFSESGGSVNRAINYVNRHGYKSLSVKEYIEILKEVGGINLSATIHRLKKKGLISESKKGYVLTPKGRCLTDKIKEGVRYRANWDGRWRLITFDIPEKKKHDRNWLRDVLRMHEYKRLHKSVFLGKFPLPEKVYREISKRKLVSHVHILVVGEIDDESKLF